MSVGIGASGIVGIAFESVVNTYVAPTKFFPVTEETLKFIQENVKRRPVKGNTDIAGLVAGNTRIEGNLGFECLEDVLPYFLYAGQWTVVKSGSTPNFVYTFTPANAGTAAGGRTLSITVVRNGVTFGYVGCLCSELHFTISDGLLMCTASIIGSDEATQSTPTPTFPTTIPFGAGQYSIEIPTATPVEDSDELDVTINNHASAEYRLRTTGRGAKFVKFGERDVTFNLTRDFQNRTDYDAFKAITSQSITLTASKGANNSISMLFPAAIKDDYEITGIGKQADLIRAKVPYIGVYDNATSKSCQIVVKTQEDIT